MEKIKLKLKNEWIRTLMNCFLILEVAKIGEQNIDQKVIQSILQVLYKKIASKSVSITPSNIQKKCTLSLEYYQAYCLEVLLREKAGHFEKHSYEYYCIKSIADQLNQKLA